MLTYAITDRQSLAGDLTDFARRALATGVDLLQIREKDLSAQELYEAALAIRRLPNPGGAAILINERSDIAVAAELDGVHLPSDAPSPAAIRGLAWGLRIGVSCHTLDEVRRAGAEGADFVVFSPVFPPRSKAGALSPVGLDGLAAACRASAVPTLALGGVSIETASRCLAAGAAGVAGVSLFQSSVDLAADIDRLRRL